MSQFLNSRESIVVEAIDGAIRTSNGMLARLSGFPSIKVVVRSDWNKSKVAIVSGGGSGHEPSHVGFIGKGMLTAAVCGDVFASPSVDAILAGILAVTGDYGCLLVVKNYTGDRLNFGLAAERARALGKRVNMVIVDDDIALPDLPQARGLAGTLFVHKIAGFLAESGASLEEVTEAAKSVIDGTISIGMSLSTCTVPGSPRELRIPNGKAELGLGIHGEPGVELIDFSGAKVAIQAVVNKLFPFMDAQEYSVLLNNLGGTSVLEMSVLANELLDSEVGSKIKSVVGPAALMTSLDMQGFSLSLIKLNDLFKRALAFSVDAPAWPGISTVCKVKVLEMPEGVQQASLQASDNEFVRSKVQLICETLLSSASDLNALDAKTGDGDTGSTLAGAATAILSGIDLLPLNETPALFRAVGQTLSQVMGGSSGVLLAIFFTAAGDAASKGSNLQDSLQYGLSRMQHIGGAKPGDRTMVDALIPSLSALGQGIKYASIAARQGAENTALMTRARSGRSSYVNASQLLGNIDPGAEAVARIFEALV